MNTKPHKSQCVRDAERFARKAAVARANATKALLRAEAALESASVAERAARKELYSVYAAWGLDDEGKPQCNA